MCPCYLHFLPTARATASFISITTPMSQVLLIWGAGRCKPLTHAHYFRPPHKDQSVRLHTLCDHEIWKTHQKVKVKVAFSTLRPFGLLYSSSQQVPAFISRGATHHTDAQDLYQRRRELLPNFDSKFEFAEIC